VALPQLVLEPQASLLEAAQPLREPVVLPPSQE
jgi:hypothetical protein